MYGVIVFLIDELNFLFFKILFQFATIENPNLLIETNVLKLFLKMNEIYFLSEKLSLFILGQLLSSSFIFFFILFLFPFL